MLEFIEDLGIIEYGSKGNRRRHWKMQCSCGEVLIVPSNNVKSGNTTKCKVCANRNSAVLAMQEAAHSFADKAQKQHGNSFDYSNVKYIDSYTKVDIKCNTCYNAFSQSPHCHLRGNGCPTCADNGFKMDKPAILYYFKIKGVYKIGVTGRPLEQRYNKADRAAMESIQTWYFDTGRSAYEYEQNLLKMYNDYKFTGSTPFTDGTSITECFCTDIYALDML